MVGPRSESETTGDDNAVHGDSKSQQGIGSRYPARQETSCRHGQVQRGAGESGRLARSRRSAAELEGRSREILRNQAGRDRWAIRRDEGADRGVLAVSGEIVGRGDRVGQARSKSVSYGGIGNRDSPGARRRRLWSRVRLRAEGVRRARWQADGRERKEIENHKSQPENSVERLPQGRKDCVSALARGREAG